MVNELLVVLLFYLGMATGDSQYYGYALPSGYVSGYRSPVQHQIGQIRHPVQPYRHVARPLGYTNYNQLQYSNYYNHQPFQTSVNSYRAPGPYTYRILPGGRLTSNNIKSSTIPAKQPVQSANLVSLDKNPSKPSALAGTSDNKLKEDSKKGFKLLDDLVKTVSQAAGTSTDSDASEVNAVKSIFADVIDEIVRQIEMKFKENNLDESISAAFLRRSETTKKAVSEAPNQTILSTILKPYVADLKKFTAKGLQTIA